MNNESSINDNNSKKKSYFVPIFGVILLIGIIFLIAFFKTGLVYKVTFDSDGGNEVLSQDVKKGKRVIEPKDPIKESYIFMYWTLNDEKYDFNEPVKKSITLKAKWMDTEVVNNDYTVVFDSDGGTQVDFQIVKGGEKLIKPQSPTKDGYLFDNWYLDSKIFDFDVLIDKDLTLVAHWKKIQSNSGNGNKLDTSSSNVGSGSNSVSNVNTVNYYKSNIAPGNSEIFESFKINVIKKNNITYFNDGFPVPSKNPTQDGYEFIEWSQCKNNIDCDFDLNAKSFDGIRDEFRLYPRYKYVTKTPQLTATYVKQITFNTLENNESVSKTYDVYKITNNNYTCASLGSTNCYRKWVLFTRKAQQGAGPENAAVRSIVYSMGINISGHPSEIYNVSISEGYYEVSGIEYSNYIYVAIVPGWDVVFKAIEHGLKSEYYDYSGVKIDTSSQNVYGELISDFSNVLRVDRR